MALGQFLYTITAHDEPVVDKHILTNGITGACSHNFPSTFGQANAGTLLIDAAGQPENGSPVGIAMTNKAITDTRNLFNRVHQGNGTYAGTKQNFSMIVCNTEQTTVAAAITALGAGTSEEDWDGAGKSLTFHTPSLDPGTYTLVVPTDAVVYQTSVQRAGNVLVWHIPAGQLGVYTQNANLASAAITVTAADPDAKAAAQLWAAGYILIDEQGTQLPYTVPSI